MSFWFQADLFVPGMLLAVLYEEVKARRLRLPRWWRPAGVALLLAAVAASAVLWTESGITQLLVYQPVLLLACTALLALVVLPHAEGAQPTSLTHLLEVRPVVWLGLISYSLFLWHEPLLYVLRDHGLTRPGVSGFVLNAVLLVVVAAAASWMTYRGVEYPGPRPEAPPVLAAQAALAEAAPCPGRDLGRVSPALLSERA